MIKILAMVVFFVFLISGTTYGSLIAYYPFDSNANDSSGNGHHGTVNGDVFFDGSANFDGDGDYISVNDDGSLGGMSELTVKVKFKMDYWPVWETDNGAITLVSNFNNGDGVNSTDSYGISLYKENNKYTV